MIYASLNLIKRFIFSRNLLNPDCSLQESFYDGENSTESHAVGVLPQLGKTFMLPVALLSFCGIMLALVVLLAAMMS